MADLELTLACGDYELTRPLTAGLMQAEGGPLVPATRYGAKECPVAIAHHNAYNTSELNAPS